MKTVNDCYMETENWEWAYQNNVQFSSRDVSVFFSVYLADLTEKKNTEKSKEHWGTEYWGS